MIVVDFGEDIGDRIEEGSSIMKNTHDNHKGLTNNNVNKENLAHNQKINHSITGTRGRTSATLNSQRSKNKGNIFNNEDGGDVDYFMSCTTGNWVPGISASFFDEEYSRNNYHNSNSNSIKDISSNNGLNLSKQGSSSSSRTTTTDDAFFSKSNSNSIYGDRQSNMNPDLVSNLSSNQQNFLTPNDSYFTKYLSSFSFLSNNSRNTSLNSLTSLDTNETSTLSSNNTSPNNIMYARNNMNYRANRITDIQPSCNRNNTLTNVKDSTSVEGNVYNSKSHHGVDSGNDGDKINLWVDVFLT